MAVELGISRRRGAMLGAAAFVAAGALAAPGAADARSIQWGFSGGEYLAPVPSFRATWFDRTLDANASLIRIPVDWRRIAPADRPADFDPRDPADPAYDWLAVGDLDGAIRDAAYRGLDVLLTVTLAPSWAEGPRRRAGAPAGTWRPDPDAYGDFATALASRYSGEFVGPSGPLPRVRLFQAWNEPNLATYLNPQWKRRKPRSPGVYRGLLNAFFDAVKAVEATNVVISGGTAPNGDRPGGRRMRPLRFYRRLFCLRGSSRRGGHCRARTRFDVLAHHPIGAGPRRHASHRDDVAFADFGRLRRVLRRGRRAKRIRPRGAKPIWATEFFWDTDPPDSFGIPEGRQARWIADGLYRLWRQRVDLAILLQIHDDAPPSPTPAGYASSLQSGVFFLDGQPKLGFYAARFPFVANRRRGGKVRVWGVAPQSGPLLIERRRRGRWQPVKGVVASGGEVFVTGVGRRRGRLRARVGSFTSLDARPR